MTESPPPAPLARWQNAVPERGAGLADFWNTHLAERDRDVLLMLGRGFDPRMCLGTQMLFGAGGKGRRDVHVIQFAADNGSLSADQQRMAEVNWVTLQAAVKGRAISLEDRVIPRTEEGRFVGPRKAANLYNDSADLAPYTDLVIDISSIPRGLYFPLLARLLYLIDGMVAGTGPNLHVLVAEDPALDARIQEEGVEQSADFLFSFEGRFTQEATAEYPRVWIPILGEGRTHQFDRIYDLVKPDETALVLPSPSLNPRRGDDILTEYRELLFDQLRIDPRNILYASEGNPIDVYRQIRRAVVHYHKVLGLLSGCKVALSALSSKVMSLGALLVAYELRQSLFNVGIAHIDSQRYTIDAQSHAAQLVGLWLAGECYAT
jgi:hypothetical protein